MNYIHYMNGLAPGSILQLMFLKSRIKKLRMRSFIEIGSGNGQLSNVLLKLGYEGFGFDLNSSACDNNEAINRKYIAQKKYRVINKDFLSTEEHFDVDLIISSMVIEHLNDEQIRKYIEKAKECLSDHGQLIFLVPAHEKYWSIEDDTAGHLRRYDAEMIRQLASEYNLKLKHLKGLTFPVSNILLPLSNYIIKKNESDRLSLDQKQRTIHSGNRGLKFKTTFPNVFKLILNPIVLYPFYLIQKLEFTDKFSLVYYFEYRIK